ncbi:MAG: riboflavin synthase [Burkholderiales bacterium]|nr:riboflavin synthase [Burkholderiales bacterium]
MFTGIIEEIGKIDKINKQNKAMQITISAQQIMHDLKLGDSIAVNGVCLTVTSFSAQFFTVDVMPETFLATTMSREKNGSLVNLERALAIGGRLGGHFVTGHVDGVGEITSITSVDNAINYTIGLKSELLKYCIDRGSIAVDGTSLTIFGIDKTCIKLALIPHTIKNTVLGYKKVGDKVNIECDLLGKYVNNLLFQNMPLTIDQKFLIQNGFM